MKELTPKDVHPSISPAFSPNLHKWLNKHPNRISKRGSFPKVFVYTGDDPAFKRMRFFIGWMSKDSSTVSAVFLGSALSGPDRASTLTFRPPPVSELEVVEDFWERYLKIGRCAIDTHHSINFLRGDRWESTSKDTRRCRWCGQTQSRGVKVVTEEVEVWKNN